MKKKILALSLILSLTALSGCKGDESELSSSSEPLPQTSNFTTTAPATSESVESTEPEREIVTSAETKEEVIALFLKAFSEKDTETLNAFHCGNFDESYNEMFNRLCKALDNEGNLPDDINEIDLDPRNFEVYRKVSLFNAGGEKETWEATYVPANGHFTIYFRDFSDFDYISQTYSVEWMQLYGSMAGLTALTLDDYRQYVASGEPYLGISNREVYIYDVDITPYLD